MFALRVGQRADRDVVEFIVVVTEGVETQVVKHFGRYEEHGIGEVVSAIHGVHDMARHDECQIVLAMGDDTHVVHGSCTATQGECQNDVREHIVLVAPEKTLYLAHYHDARLLNGFCQLLAIVIHISSAKVILFCGLCKKKATYCHKKFLNC